MTEYYGEGSLLIAGTRFRMPDDPDWRQGSFDYIARRVEQAIEFYNPTSIIHGGAPGADAEGGKAAQELGFSDDQIKIVRPDWNQFPKSAGFIRNKEMVEICRYGVVLWNGKSGGTKDTLGHLFKMSKPHTIHMVTPAERRRFFPTKEEERVALGEQGKLDL